MSVIEKWIQQKVNIDKLSTSSVATSDDVDSKISAAVPTVIDAEKTQIIEKKVWHDPEDNNRHLITCVFNSFPANARINYDIRYNADEQEITEKGYITIRDFFWLGQGNQNPFAVNTTERTLDSPLEFSLEISMNYYYDDNNVLDTTKYQLDFDLKHCNDIVSSDITLVLPEKNGVYSAVDVDRLLCQLKEDIDACLDSSDTLHNLLFLE